MCARSPEAAAAESRGAGGAGPSARAAHGVERVQRFALRGRGQGGTECGVRGVDDHGLVRRQIGADGRAVAQHAGQGEEERKAHEIPGQCQAAGAVAAADAWSSPRWRI